MAPMRVRSAWDLGFQHKPHLSHGNAILPPALSGMAETVLIDFMHAILSQGGTRRDPGHTFDQASLPR